MSFEIAQAFVRIRPNMAGFKSETETGVTSAFSGAFSKAATIVGIGFGAKMAFDFTKSMVNSAATLQKQVEVINAEFGSAGGSVKQFGATAAAALGMSKELADTTSARFGILFKNLGIGQQEAAGMTVGLEKLAGSISMMRGVDPSTVLARLPLALAGNVRALKQLGLGIDQSQIKLAALKLGLISSTKDAITPAVKAQAIYALATANLGSFMQQAKAHAGDLRNVQMRLSAEWANAKEQLAAGLLPALTKLLTVVERWLSRMQKSGALQRDFNSITRVTVSIVKDVAKAIGFGVAVFKTFSDAVGGAKNALVILFTVMAVNKIRSIATTILTQLVQRGLGTLKLETQAAKDEWIAANGQMKAATIGLATTIKTALISTAIGLLVVAVGIAVGYVITHWDTVKRVTVALVGGIVGLWQGLKTTLVGIAEFIGGSMAESLLLPFKVLLDGASMVSGLLDSLGIHIGGFVKQAQQSLNSVSTDLMGRGVANIIKGGQQMASGFGKNWNEALAKSTKDSTGTESRKKFGQAIAQQVSGGAVASAKKGAANVAAAIAKGVGDGMGQAVQAAQQRIADSVGAAKNNLDKIGQQLADSVNKVLDKLGGAGGSVETSPQAAAFKRLVAQMKAGGDTAALERATQQLGTELQAKSIAQTAATSRRAQIKQNVADLTAEFNRGAISLGTFNQRVAALLKANGVSYKVAGQVLGRAFSDGFKGQLGALGQQAQALAALPARLRGIGGAGGSADPKIIRPLEVMRSENAKIASRAEKQRERQIKAAEKQAAAAGKMSATLATLAHVKVGTLPGRSSKSAKTLAAAGVQP